MKIKSHQLKIFAIIFSLLIMLSSITVVNLTLEIVRGETARGEEKTWYVDDDALEGGDGSQGKPYRKIQDAIDNATDEDTVRVFNGTYFENILVNKSLNLIGNGSETTTIDGKGSGDVVKITANWVNMSAFMVTGSGGSSSSGIKVESDHTHIFENNCSNNGNGIYLLRSSNSRVENNTCSNNYEGIEITSSSYCKIMNNTCSANDQRGIHLISSNDCMLTNNTFSANYGADLFLRNSGDSTFKGNMMNGNGIYIEGNLENWNSYTIDATNSVNGKPVYYIKNDEGLTVPFGAGQVIIANCVLINVVDQNCSNGLVGIMIGFSSFITIANNTCSSNNYAGIHLVNSNDCTIMDNIGDNNNQGIFLDSSKDCRIENNIINYNNRGIYIQGSSDSTLNRNTVNNNDGNGIQFSTSNACTITNNICSSNRYSGIQLGISNDATVRNNICENNGHSGINLFRFDRSTITNNTCSSNKNNGIILRESDSNSITHGTISNNDDGIYLHDSSWDNTVEYNNIYNNTGDGVSAKNNDGNSVNARNNWWGDTSGPYHPAENHEGKGDNVTDYVDFDPWISQKLFRTFFVAKSGNDTLGNGTLENPFLTIQKAVDESNDLDTIRVFEGVYEENAVVDKNVEIIGNGSGETVIQGLGESELVLTELGNFVTGNTNNVFVVDDHAYLATGSIGLVILNISNKSDPKKIGQYDTDGSALDVAVSGNFAYVADGKNGLVILNIQDPGNPILAGHYGTQNNVGRIIIDENHAFLGKGIAGLEIVEITNASVPFYVGNYNTTDNLRDIAVSEDFAYLIDIQEGLVVLDIANKSNPQKLGNYKTEESSYAVAVSGDYAYIATANTSSGDGGVEIINVSQKDNLISEEFYDSSNWGGTVDIVISGDFMYLIDRWQAFEITDISDKKNPVAVHREEILYDEGGRIFIHSDSAYIIDQWLDLVIFDISNKNDPTFSGRYDPYGGVESVDIEGSFAYLAIESSGLAIVELNDIYDPQLIGYYTTFTNGLKVVVDGDYAYLSDNGDVFIIDITDKSNPILTGYYDRGGNIASMVVSGNFLYIGGHEFLGIISISDKSNPVLEGEYETDLNIREIEVHGNYAYVAATAGLTILDVSNKSNPYYVGSCNPSTGVEYGLTVSGNYAYVFALGSGNLAIIDLKDKANPQVKSNTFLSHPNGVALKDDHAYVTNSGSGLHVFDVSNKNNPILKAILDTAGRAGSLMVKDNHIYVADGDNGLVIVKSDFPPEAVITISASNTKLSGLTFRNGSRAGVLVNADNVEIEQCKITANYDGIKIINESENVNIQDCDIFKNSALGANAWDKGEKSVDATNNWWGHPSGPFHPTRNTGGKGNIVSDYVNFNPWLSRPIDFKVHYVSPDGNELTGNGNINNPFGSIQKAIDLANEWDTIVMASGTYSESITANKRNITIIGDSPTTTIIDAGGAATAGGITADDVVMKGFTFRNATENGMFITNSSGVKIINCAFPENSYDLNLSNGQNIQLINTTFETVKFNDQISSISVLWPVDLKVTDNRSGFIPGAYTKITDTFGTTVFDGYTDHRGRIPQIDVLEYYQNISTQTYYNPYTVSVWGIGYLDFSEDFTVESHSPVTCELQHHILPIAIISGEIIQKVDMDSEIFFDGSESTGRSITYHWDFGDNTSSSSPTPPHTYIAPGAYQVNLTVTDDYQNTSTASIIVIVENVIPIARADSDLNSIFEDETIRFDASDSWDSQSDSISFLWDFGDRTQSDKIMPTHSYEKQGIYDVSLTAIDLFGGESSTHLFITVANNAPWDVSAGENRSVYTREIVEFQGSAMDTLSDSDSLKYTWDFGDGMTSEGQEVTHLYDQPGEYIVNLTVSDNNGASDYALVKVRVIDPEIITYISSTSLFQDEEVFFEASHELDDGSFIYTWYFGDGLSQAWNETYQTYDRSGIFSPYIIIDTGNENITIFQEEIVVKNVIPTPVIVVDELLVSEGDSIHFDGSTSSDSASDKPHLTYLWDFGDGTTGIGTNMNHAFSDSGSYTVSLTVSDGKGTNTTQVEIEVENLPPTANAGTSKERKATVGKVVILDASQSLDSYSDVNELNFTWKIGDDRIYGKIVSYIFEEVGSYSVILEVRDNSGAESQDSLTFTVSKSSSSDDEESMSIISWILLVIMVALLVVIGFLISKLRDEALYKEMKAEQAEEKKLVVEEEAIVVEGEIDQESFKPQVDDQEATVAVAEEQNGDISDHGVEGVEE